MQEEEASAADVIWSWAEQVMEKGSLTPGWEAHGREVDSRGHPGTGLRGWLMGRSNGKGGEGRAGAKVGHGAERHLLRTGDKRPNLEVVREEEPPLLGLLLILGMGNEWRVGKVGRGPGVSGGKLRKERVLGTLEGHPGEEVGRGDCLDN